MGTTVEHYFSSKPSGKEKRTTFSVTLRGNELTFVTSSGVFSKEHVDVGSKLLIEECVVEEGWDVLDLGCGYGAVGIAIAKAYSSCNIVCSDVNQRAVLLTQENAEKNKVEHVTAVVSDGYQDVEGKFDTILLNPPQTAGKEICLQLIAGAREHLKEHGMLQIVARPNKGGKTLAAFMKESYGNVDILGRGNGFAVYRSTS